MHIEKPERKEYRAVSICEEEAAAVECDIMSGVIMCVCVCVCVCEWVVELQPRARQAWTVEL